MPSRMANTTNSPHSRTADSSDRADRSTVDRPSHRANGASHSHHRSRGRWVQRMPGRSSLGARADTSSRQILEPSYACGTRKTQIPARWPTPSSAETSNPRWVSGPARLRRLQSPYARAFGVHDRRKMRDRLIQVVVHDQIVVLPILLQLTGRIRWSEVLARRATA